MHDEDAASKRFRSPGRERRSLRLLPLKLAGAYFLVAALWIFTSDFWLAALVADPVVLTYLQSIKGLLFVTFTACMLYWLLRRSLRTLQQTETTLRESEARLRLILQSMPVMLNAFDRQGNIIIWNQECERVTGYGTAEIIDNPQAMTLLYPEATYRQQMVAAWAERGNDYRNWEWDLVCKDGSVKTVAWSNLSDRFPIAGWQSWGIGVDVTDRKRAETSLRESEARFRLVTETIQEVFWLCSADKQQVFYVSPAYEQLWGRSCDSIYQNPRSVLETIHPADREHVADSLAHPSKEAHEFEYRIIKPDGAVRWIVNRSFPIRDRAGQIYRTAGVSRDITEHKEAEIALRENEAFFKLALDFTHIGSWDWRIPTNKVIWNENHARLLGLVPGEVPASYQAWRDRVHPDDINQVEQTLAQALETKTNFETEYRVVHPDGSVHWLNGRGRGIYDASGQVIRMIGVVLDLTDRKQAEAQIRQLNQTLEQQNLALEALVEQRTAELMTFINTLPDYIFVVERDTMRMPFCNDAIAHLIGWENRHQVAGKTIFECFAPDLATTFAEQNQQVFTSGETLHFQECYTTSLGTLHFDTYKIPLKQPDGEVYALIGSSRDITELVEARQELADRTTQLEIVNRELESFSYSVSHDLRAPLRHINGFVAALNERLDQNGHLTDPTVTHYLQIIQNSSQKMGQLIDGLLTLSRVGRRQIAQNPVDLHQLVATVLSQRPEGGNATSTIAVTSEPSVQFRVGELPTVLGDAVLLQQVFANLIDNAVKFSRDRHPAQIEIGTLADGTIFVRDNGVGFQMEYADQLFGAFQRLHSRSEFEGSGIGLAIVQRIIHRHSGHIWADSQLEQGSTFYFKLGDRPLSTTAVSI